MPNYGPRSELTSPGKVPFQELLYPRNQAGIVLASLVHHGIPKELGLLGSGERLGKFQALDHKAMTQI